MLAKLVNDHPRLMDMGIIEFVVVRVDPHWCLMCVVGCVFPCPELRLKSMEV